MNEMLKRALDARIKYRNLLVSIPDYPRSNRERRRMVQEFIGDIDNIIGGI